MRPNVSLAPRPTIRVPTVVQPMEQLGDSRQTAFELIRYRKVSQENPKERRQVVTVPVTAEIRLGDGQASAEDRVPVEARIAHIETCLHIASQAKRGRSRRIGYLDCSATQTPQLLDEQSPRESIHITPIRRHGSGIVIVRGDL